MKHIDTTELINAVPIKMTKREKLSRWADLVRNSHHILYLYHNLEYTTSQQRRSIIVVSSDRTAFSVATQDKEFIAQGLKADSTLQDVLDFFELSLPQAHAFSCDCGGDISNDEQARRIERLA